MDPAASNAARFYDDLSEPTPLFVILRAAMHVEDEMWTLVGLALPNPEALKRSDLENRHLIALVVALGLDRKLQKPLQALSAIRNRFAHRVDAKFEQSEATSFYNTFSSAEQQLMHGTYTQLKAKGAFPTMPKSYNALEPMDKFRIGAVTLRAALVAGQSLVRSADASPSRS